jgi:hypothetical protein
MEGNCAPRFHVPQWRRVRTFAGVILDAAGNVYGATEMGGNPRCGGGCGTVWRPSPRKSRWVFHSHFGNWSRRSVHFLLDLIPSLVMTSTQPAQLPTPASARPIVGRGELPIQ